MTLGPGEMTFGRLDRLPSSHKKFYVDFGVEMFNKVILTYFTPLSSCGSSLTLLKRRNIDCNQNCFHQQVSGGSESVMRYVYW